MKKIQLALIGLVLAMVFGMTNPAYAGRTLVLDVVADTAAFDIAFGDVLGGGAFYVPGVIYEAGTNKQIGTFHCWGWDVIGDGLSAVVVSQEYNLDGRGKIQVQGVESFKGLTGFPPFADAEEPGIRAVVGGTGDFRRVRGDGEFEVLAFDLGAGLLQFQARFNLIS